MNIYLTKTSKIENIIQRFIKYVHFRDETDENTPINFENMNSFLGSEENYKSNVYEKAREALKCDKWTRSMIGTGNIIKSCAAAMNCSGNLVNYNQKTQFRNIITPGNEKYNPEAEQAIYDIYKSNENQEEYAFTQAVKVFGGHYDTIAYLFYIKNSLRFLPISSGNFEKSLFDIGVDYALSGKCSWENYNGFVEIVREVQAFLRNRINDDIRLIDAHSFLWIINEKGFREWVPPADTKAKIETATEQALSDMPFGNAVKKHRTIISISRNQEVSKKTKTLANGICQLCEQPAPFIDKNSDPYLESHHIKWLSDGGEDSLKNTVALCPNCHTKMHIVNDENDVKKLLAIAEKRFNNQE